MSKEIVCRETDYMHQAPNDRLHGGPRGISVWKTDAEGEGVCEDVSCSNSPKVLLTTSRRSCPISARIVMPIRACMIAIGENIKR
jgi:hypothetical protein